VFKTFFHKLIWDGETVDLSKHFAILQREESLPFAPTPGMTFFWGTDKPALATEVRWDFAEQRFACKAEDEFAHTIGIDDYDFDWLLKNAQDSGWTLISKQGYP